ncbi:MAG: M48 family metallopeptidase [Hyphomonadaceae bacterium]|nr:M48 family metallopeptidase [Hyphomonadaceae bacterium]
MIQGRYADGRAAITHDAECDIGPDAITFRVRDAQHIWPYGDLRRADDGAGLIVLKRRPDTGERLMLDADAKDTLRAAAPSLFRPRAFGVEPPSVVGGLIAGAWSLAAVFLVGVPLAAAPIADIIPPRYREQIADISWSQVEALTEFCDDSDEASRVLNDLAYRMMTAANVEGRDDIWVIIVDAPIPNAFALPDNSIVVTDDLIALADHPDELTGVIAHEIAHIERNHVLKNIIRSVGAGIFFDIVFGGAGAGQAVAIASVNLASLSYSRDDETDADMRGLEYLDAAGIDTGGLARLFDRLAEQYEGEEASDFPSLFSTHPATSARAEVARQRSRAGLAPSMNAADWRIVQSSCGMDPAAGTESEETPKPPEQEGVAKP